MKYEDLVKMSVKELKDRLKDLNTQAQAAAGKDLDALLEEATTITGILDDVKNREKLAGIAKDAEGGAEPTGGEKGEEVKDKAREERGQNIKDGKAVKFSAKKTFGVKNALSVSQTVTPTHSAADMKETFNDASSLVDRVTPIPLNGGETYQRGYVKSYGDGAGGTAEGGDYNATEPVFGYVTIEKQKITAYTEEPEEMIKELNKKNIHLSLWNYPYLQEDSPAFKELAERGFFIKNKEGHPAMFKATADSEFLCACFDFTNPEFLAWYEERVKKIVRMGVSVIKTDFSEAVPEDVVFYNGMSGREGHNLLTYLYAKNIYTWMKEICDERGELPMLWGRSGYVGSHTIPAAWAGDSSSDKASHSAILQAGLGMAMSGVSFWGYDLGGFYNTGYIGNEERPNIEDYLSSVQMGLWMPLSRAHGKTPREPWQYGDMALKEVKKWINFRHRLVPYLYHTACQSHQSGIPMIRPLVMEYPKDPIAKTQNLSYMLGDALLISPGFDRDEYELYLPEGRWQDIESKEVYEGMTFVHIENKAFADGGTSLRVFQKEGTSIPLFAQKEVLHVPAQLWKQEDLEFMIFQKKDVD